MLTLIGVDSFVDIRPNEPEDQQKHQQESKLFSRRQEREAVCTKSTTGPGFRNTTGGTRGGVRSL